MKRITTLVPAALLAALFLAGCAPASASVAAGSALKAYLARRSGDAEGAAAQYRRAIEEDPESVVLRIELSEILIGLGRGEEALAVLDGGLALRSGDVGLLYRRARVLALLGRVPEATRDAVAAARDGGNAEASLLAVRLLIAVEDAQGALDVADAWAARSPGDDGAHYQRGVALTALDREKEAAEAFRRAAELNPGNLDALEALGGRARAAGDAETARGYYRRMVEANPHQVGARISLIELDAEAGRADEALAALRQAERWGGDLRERLRMGLLYFRLNALEDAERVFAGVENTRGDGNVYLLLGSVRLARERFDAAIEAFGKVPVGSDFYDEAILRKGLALDKAGRGDEALALLRWLHEEKPEDLGRLEGYAIFLRETGKKREALDLLEGRFAANDPRDTGLYYLAGSLADELGEVDRCIGLMRRVLEVDPEHAQAMNYIAYTLALQGSRLDEAETLARRALELMPGNGAVIDTLGWVLFREGRTGEARTELERAAALLPRDPVIREHLGDVYRALGEKALARAEYEEALKLDPKNAGLPAKVEEVK